jgi:acetyltransferase
LVPNVIRECVLKKVKACIVVSAGFSESGNNLLQAEVLALASQGKMRVLGPNTLGLIRPATHLNASFGLTTPAPGKIAFLTQSGALADSVIDWSLQEDYAFSAIVSVGNAVDVGFPTLIRYFADDAHTQVIACYVEGLSNGRQFMDAVKYAFKKGKPVVVLKGGTTSVGQKAASTHTASMASDVRVFSGAMIQSGAVSVGTLSDLFGVSKALSDCEKSKKPWAVLTNAGGVGVLVSDACARNNVSLAVLSKKTIHKLDACLPSTWSKANPVDIIGDATSIRYQSALKVLLSAPEVGGVMVVQTLQTMTDTDANAKKIAALSKTTKKPVVTLFLGGKFSHQSMVYLNRHGVPDFNDPEALVVAVKALSS